MRTKPMHAHIEFMQDDFVSGVIAGLQAARRRPASGGPLGNVDAGRFIRYADCGFAFSREQRELMYLLCRAIAAKRVARFAMSVAMPALYFAAAVAGGGGLVIGSELLPQKVAQARRSLADAHPGTVVDIREGDARRTLRDLGGPADFVLIDGWSGGASSSLARAVIEIVAPQVRVGGLVLNDTGERDCLDYVHDPANGFLPLPAPFTIGDELSLKASSGSRGPGMM